MTTALELGRPVDILLVEDNLGDVDLAREGLEEGKLLNRLSVARDGEEAMAFLRRQGPYTDAPIPDVILLDLNLPRKDGRQVLAEIKSDAQLQHIPVIIMTTSRDEADILKSYRLHANCYITKPLRLQRFIEVVQAIETFWFTIVALPQEKRP